jgi:hypothetical protein
MPDATAIHDQLSTMASDLGWLAIGWHFAIVALLVPLMRGWRPDSLTVVLLCALPLGSVAIVALVYGNPFNTVSVAALVVALAIASAFADDTLHRSRPLRFLGLGLVLFGLVYPHFATPWYRALYAAPVGVVPCPTLAVVAGFILMTGMRARAMAAVLALWTSFYAMFGILRLGVTLDAGLFVATACLAYLAVRGGRLPYRDPQRSRMTA